MKTILYFETPSTRIKLSKQLAELLKDRQMLAAGDGRKTKVKQARCDFDYLSDALTTLGFRYYEISGESELDLSV
jgi:hypothetical protein